MLPDPMLVILVSTSTGWRPSFPSRFSVCRVVSNPAVHAGGYRPLQLAGTVAGTGYV